MYSDPNSTPLAVITASSLPGYDKTSFAHLKLDFEQFVSTDPLKDLSGLFMETNQWTAIFISLQTCSFGFKSLLCLGHSRTITQSAPNHSRW